MKRIQPCQAIEGKIVPPSDKSIFHRALLFNGMAMGRSVIEYNGLSKDVISSISCMKKLGAKIRVGEREIEVFGLKKWRGGTLHCGNSATTMRLLAGMLAGRGVKAKLIGDSSLSARPMDRIQIPLAEMGGNISSNTGRAPLSIAPATLTGKSIRMAVNSAQVKSALLLAGLSATGTTEVVEKIPTRNHTENMLKQMGASLVVNGESIKVQRGELSPLDICLPGDVSSASYFIALGVLCGKIEVEDTLLNERRIGFLNALKRMGAKIEMEVKAEVGGEKKGRIIAKKSKLTPLCLREEEVPSLVDEIPLLAIVCAFAEGESRLCGLNELRYKESNRLEEVEKLLLALGGKCHVDGDDLIVEGKPLVGGNYSSSDHRLTMTASVALCASERGGCLDGEKSVEISFPRFFEELALVGGKVE